MAKKEYSPTSVEFVNIDGINYAQTTKKDDLINITGTLGNVVVKASKGTDAISFDGLNSVADLKDDSKIAFKHVAGTKNLEIDLFDANGDVSQTVVIENFYKKTDGKATGSSLKNVKLTGENGVQYVSIIDKGLIDYESIIKANSKGKATGTAFNDTIVGSIKNDTIKGGKGDDTLYGDAGNDKLYGGKGKDTFIFDTYSKENKMTGGTEYYGSGKDTVMDADVNDTLEFKTSGIEQIKFSQSKNNLVITYSDVNDVLGDTKENTVTIKNYYKQKEENRVTNIVAMDADGNATEYTFTNEGKIYENGEQVNLVEVLEARAANKAAAEAKAAEDARKAAEYDGLVAELTQTQDNLEQTEADLEQAQADYQDAKTNYENKKAELEAYEATHSKTDAEYQQIVEDMNEAQSNYETAQANYEQKKAELTAYTNSHTHDNTEWAVLTEQKDAAAANYETAQANYEQAQADLTSYRATHAHDNVDWANLVDAKAAADQALVDYEATHSNTDAEYEALAQEKAVADQALADYKANHNKTDAEYQAVSDAYDEAYDNYQTALQDYQAKVTELDKYTEEHVHNNTEWAVLTEQKDAAAANYATAQENYEQATADLTAYRATHAHDNQEWTNLVEAKELADQAFNDYKANHTNTDAQFTALEQAKAAADEALATYEENHSHSDAEWGELLAAKNTAQSNYETAQENYEQAQADLTAYTNTHTHNNTEWALLDQAKTTAETNYATAQANYEQATADLTAYTATHTHDNVEWADLTQAKVAADQALTDYKADHTKTDAQYQALVDEKAQAVAEFEAYAQNHSKTDAQYTELEQAKAAADQALTDYKSNHNKTDAQYQELVDAKAAADQALTDYEETHSHDNTEWGELLAAKNTAQSNYETAQANYEQAQADLTAYTNTHTHDNTEWALLNQAKTTAETNYATAQANLLAKVSELATYEANHLKTNAEYQALEQAKAAADQALTDYEATHSKTDAQYQDMVDAKNAADQALADYMEDYAHSNTEYQEKVDAVTAAETARDAAITDKATAEAALTAYQENHSKTDAEYQAMSDAYDEAYENYQTAQGNYNAKVNELALYKAEHEHTDAEYQAKVDALTQALDDLATAQGTVATLTGQKATLEGQVTTLTTEKAALQAQLDAIANGAKDYSEFEDTTLSATKTSEYDRLVFANSSFTNCDFTQNGDDLVITYHDDKGGTSEEGTLTLKDYFKPTTTNKIDNFVDKDGNTHSITDALNGFSPAVKTVEGTDGPDEFTPTADKELFIVNGGADTFNDSDSADKVAGDKVQLTDTTKQSDVTYSRTVGDNDLVINYAEGDSVKMTGYFAEDKYSPETLITNDAEFNVASDLETKGITVYGTDNADNFTPTDLKETYVAGDGDVILSSDSYQKVKGDGLKVSTDTNVEYRVSNNNRDDLIIYENSGGYSVTLDQYFDNNPNHYSLENIVDVSGVEYSIDSEIAKNGLVVNGTDGNDTFVPTATKETFVVGNGDKIDVTEATSDAVANDKIQITGTKNQVFYTQIVNEAAADDLVIHYDTDMTVTIGGYFGSGGFDAHYPDTIKTGSEEFNLDADIAEKGIDFRGTSSPDTFTPTTYKDNFIINGNDTIYASSGAYPTDKTTDDIIQLTCSKSDITYEKNGADLIINYGTGKKLTLVAFYDEDDVPSGAKNITVVASSDTFRLIDDLKARGVTQKGTNGNDTYSPSEFKDVIELAGGADSYAGSSGKSYAESYLSDDIIKIDCNKDEITYDFDGNALIINYSGNKSGSLTIANYFDGDNTVKDAGASTLTIVTNDNTGFNLAEDLANKGIKHQGTDGDDEFNASFAKDIITLVGGDDSYLGGSDKSYAESKLAEDTIKINCNKEDITYELGDEDSLVLKYSDSSLTIRKYFLDGGASSMKLITNDNSGFNIGDDLAEKGFIINTQSGDSTTFEPTSKKETFVVKNGDKISYSTSVGYAAGDKIKLTGNRDDVSYSKSTTDSNDLVVTYDSSNSITIDDYFVNGKYHPETIKTVDAEFFIADDITMKGFTLTGTGSTTFTPTAAKETFVVKNGDKISYSGSADVVAGDKIELEGTRDNVSYNISTTDSDDLVIKYYAGTGGYGYVTLDQFFSSSSGDYYYPEIIKTDDAEFNFALDFAQKGITRTGTGSTTFTPTSAKETFVVSSGDSFSGLYGSPQETYGKNDIIKLDGTKSDVSYSRKDSSDDLIINYGSDEHITLNSFYDSSGYYYPETIKTDDGKEFNLVADVANQGVTVTSSSAGQTLSLESVKEIFDVKDGDVVGYSTSVGYADGDKIKITGNRADVSYSKSATDQNDLIITFDSGKTITLDEYFANGYYNPEKLITAGAEFYIDVDLTKKGIDVKSASDATNTFTPSEYNETFDPDGRDITINCTDGSSSIDVSGDKIYISDYSNSDVKYSISGDPTTDGDLILSYSSYKVTLKHYFANADAGSIKLATYDNTNGIAVSTDMTNKGYVIDGGALYIKTEGTSGNDSFECTTEHELFVANGGNDIYSYTSSGGYNMAVGDKVELLGNRSSITYSKDPSDQKDLIITYDGGTLKLVGYFDTEGTNPNTYYCDIKLKTADDDNFTIADDMAAKGGPSLSASNNFLASLAQSTFAWQTAGADNAMTDVTMNNPDEINLMQIYTNNA